MQVADMEATHLVETSGRPELDTERYALACKQEPVAGLVKQYQEFVKRLPELSTASDEFTQTWYDSFEHEIDQFRSELQGHVDALRQAVTALKNKKRALRAEQEEQAAYCIACGCAASPAPYCKECGTPRYKELTCETCGKQMLFPVHLIAEETESVILHCPECGEQYAPVPLRIA